MPRLLTLAVALLCMGPVACGGSDEGTGPTDDPAALVGVWQILTGQWPTQMGETRAFRAMLEFREDGFDIVGQYWDAVLIRPDGTEGYPAFCCGTVYVWGAEEDGRIVFTIPSTGLEFYGTIHGAVMSGSVGPDPDGVPFTATRQ